MRASYWQVLLAGLQYPLQHVAFDVHASFGALHTDEARSALVKESGTATAPCATHAAPTGLRLSLTYRIPLSCPSQRFDSLANTNSVTSNLKPLSPSLVSTRCIVMASNTVYSCSHAGLNVLLPSAEEYCVVQSV